MKTHNDQPVLDCKLGRAEWGDQIAKLAISSKPPKTMAIHGTWGTGKTSALAQIHARLGGKPVYSISDTNIQAIENSDKIETVWFEAWQYQHENNIVHALLKEIREQLSPTAKVLKAFNKIAEVTFRTALQSIDFSIEAAGITFGLKDSVKNYKENLKDYKKRHLSDLIQADTIKKMLKNAIDILLNIDKPSDLKRILVGGKSDKKLVIFIDDLDRCEPESAYKILESIKIYLNLDNCIFILGMDMEAIQRIIAKFHENQLSLENGNSNELIKLSRLYLEKICQDIFHIPHIDTEVKLSYFSGLLLPEDGIRDIVIEIIEKYKFLPPFPRSIKIYANIVSFFIEKQSIKTLLIENLDNIELIKKFLILTYLYAFHYEIYQLIYMYPGFYNDEFMVYCNKGETKHKLLETIQLHDASIKDEFSGKAEPLDNENVILYPHLYLRQVLWIRKLVTETEPIIEDELKQFKI